MIILGLAVLALIAVSWVMDGGAEAFAVFVARYRTGRHQDRTVHELDVNGSILRSGTPDTVEARYGGVQRDALTERRRLSGLVDVHRVKASDVVPPSKAIKRTIH